MSRAAPERKKLEEVASEYRADGYDVIVEPRPEETPDWLGGFQPDLLAQRDDDHVVVEVKSSTSVRVSPSLRALADVVEKRPGWRLELIMTNRPSTKKAIKPDAPLLPPGVVAEYLGAARAMADRGYLEPAFLMAWIAFETAYRNAFARDGIDPGLGGSASVLKTLLSLGYVTGTDEMERLQTLWESRNRLAHGYAVEQRPSLDAVVYLLQLSERLQGDASSEHGLLGEQAPVRAPRVPPPGSPALVHQNELFAGRLTLDRLRIHHLNITRRFMEEADGALFTTDIFLGAVMSRSYSLVDGFVSTFDAWNPIVAAPLVRMQIDSLVRVAYVATAPNADDVAAHVLEGGEFRSLRDASGKPLTDRRLLALAAGAHPWLQAVYAATSGWVHFSPEHVRATWQVTDHTTGAGPREARIFGAVPIRPDQIPLSALQQLLGAMIKATEELFGYMEAWESRKGLPPSEQ